LAFLIASRDGIDGFGQNLSGFDDPDIFHPIFEQLPYSAQEMISVMLPVPAQHNSFPFKGSWMIVNFHGFYFDYTFRIQNLPLLFFFFCLGRGGENKKTEGKVMKRVTPLRNPFFIFLASFAERMNSLGKSN
jgi:hypothetical protein